MYELTEETVEMASLALTIMMQDLCNTSSPEEQRLNKHLLGIREAMNEINNEEERLEELDHIDHMMSKDD